MKKLLTLVVAFGFALTLLGCSDNTTKKTETKTTQTPSGDTKTKTETTEKK